MTTPFEGIRTRQVQPSPKEIVDELREHFEKRLPLIGKVEPGHLVADLKLFEAKLGELTTPPATQEKAEAAIQVLCLYEEYKSRSNEALEVWPTDGRVN